jgi:hypothetical protein
LKISKDYFNYYSGVGNWIWEGFGGVAFSGLGLKSWILDNYFRKEKPLLVTTLRGAE